MDMLECLEEIAQQEGIRILYAAQTDDGVNYIYMRGEKDYLSVFPKAGDLSRVLEDRVYQGQDLKDYLMDKDHSLQVRGTVDAAPMICLPQWTYLSECISADTTDEAINQLFWELVTGRTAYEVLNVKSRLTDYIYEKVPDAEIEIENRFGEHLYIFGYKAQAYEAYGIMDISWFDQGADAEAEAQEKHLLGSFDSFSEALTSPYAPVFLDLQDLLYSTLEEESAILPEDDMTEEEAW